MALNDEKDLAEYHHVSYFLEQAEDMWQAVVCLQCYIMSVMIIINTQGSTSGRDDVTSTPGWKL